MLGATFVSTVLHVILDVIKVTELQTGAIVLRRVTVKEKRIHKTIGKKDLFVCYLQKEKKLIARFFLSGSSLLVLSQIYP